MHPASHGSLTNIITHTKKHEVTKKIKYYNRYKSFNFPGWCHSGMCCTSFYAINLIWSTDGEISPAKSQ